MLCLPGCPWTDPRRDPLLNPSVQALILSQVYHLGLHRLRPFDHSGTDGTGSHSRALLPAAFPTSSAARPPGRSGTCPVQPGHAVAPGPGPCAAWPRCGPWPWAMRSCRTCSAWRPRSKVCRAVKLRSRATGRHVSWHKLKRLRCRPRGGAGGGAERAARRLCAPQGWRPLHAAAGPGSEARRGWRLVVGQVGGGRAWVQRCVQLPFCLLQLPGTASCALCLLQLSSTACCALP